MKKWYFYVDWGSGFTEIEGYDLDGLNIKWVRGEENDLIIRKKLDGSITLVGADADAAELYFITNGNYEVPINVYENGNSSTGTLIFEGWARKSGDYDFRRKQIKLTKFRTNDRYEKLINVKNNKHESETIVAYGSITGNFASQGQNSNANKLYMFSYNNTLNQFDQLSYLSIPNVGELAICQGGVAIVVYDNVNDTLKGYRSSSSNWVEVATRDMLRYGLKASIAIANATGDVLLVYESGYYERYIINETTGTFDFVPSSDGFITKLSHHSICRIDLTVYRIAIVDEDKKTLSNFGKYEISLGEIKYPCICELNPTNNRIAFIDAKKKKLTAYFYDTSIQEFKELGSIEILNVYIPKIAYYQDDSVILHDAISGIMRRYDYNAVTLTWTQIGSTYTLQGGYESAITTLVFPNQDIGVISSDTFVFKGSTSHSMKQLVNGLLFRENLDSIYELQSIGNGATISVDDFIIGNMKDVADNYVDKNSYNSYKYTIDEVLKIYEVLFQNYWYLDSANKIKFEKPENFILFGVDFDITALNLDIQLNQRKYGNEFDINYEELTFLNASGLDFYGGSIKYNRNSNIIESNETKFTTDLLNLIDIYTGQSNNKIENAGLILHIKNDAIAYNLCESGIGILSASEIKNYKLSQSQIYNDHWKDYRYQEKGNIEINGTTSPVQKTVKNIISFPSVELSYEQLGISQFPNEPGNLIWGTDIKSWINEFSVNLGSNKITINSRLLDL